MGVEGWRKVGDTGMTKGSYTVGKFKVMGVLRFKLWKGNSVIGTFKTFAEADRAAK